MYSQPPHGGMPPHLQSASSQAEYHSVRGEYPPPPEGYYPPPIPPHMGPPPMHPHYYEYPPPPHYMGYHPGPMTAGMPPQMPQPRPDDYDRNSLRRPKGQSSISGTATGSTGEADKSKGSKSNSSTSVLHKSRFRKERFGSFDSPSGREEEDRRKYTLTVCQQPLRARMCGFGEKDRRPIDPPPIVQLVVNDEKGNLDSSDLSMLQNPFFVLHVTLWSEDGRQERNVISNPPKTTRVLMGSLVSSPALLKNTEGEQGCYFCFPDLSIRTEGTYTLKFSLMKLGNEDRLIDSKSGIIATTFSNSFTVYSAKKFPGMTESTDLSKTFAKQGLKIPIRNDVRSRKVEQE